MSETIKHECGIALLRLLRPLAYYKEKYGTEAWGLNRLYLMMEKQHNRGQEGAGVACVSATAAPGNEYIFRERATGSGAIGEVFATIHRAQEEARAQGAAPEGLPFIGSCYMGHLRYSTTGRSGLRYVHPFLRRNNWRSRNLVLAGNFNLTNVEELFAQVVADGQHPRYTADTFIMLEQLGSMLDEEAMRHRRRFVEEGLRGDELNRRVEQSIDLIPILREASARWDGGYALIGATGAGDCFAFRDPWGIRPAFCYADDEVVAVASERAVIQTVLHLSTERVRELQAGEGLLVRADGTLRYEQIAPQQQVRPCSFERIYFSRGSDASIYRERKALGRLLVPSILEALDDDLDHTVFSFIPNTAEVAYYGMMEGLDAHLDGVKARRLAALGASATPQAIVEVLSHKVRTEKIAIKDIKLRTFITEGSNRDDLAGHVYDVTYDTIRPGEDAIAVIDDSIVRGTTLRRSIIKILARLNPRRIVVLSSSPQVRYPDCYGIDMSRMGEFIAFHAAVDLLCETGMEQVLHDTYRSCVEQEVLPPERMKNAVKAVYAPFTDEQIASRIARLVTPADCRCPVTVLYQTIEGLHRACPEHRGDWYFSGDYPTPGGTRLVNRAYAEWYAARYPQHTNN